MEIFLTSEAWIALLTLTFLEIVLGIDNIIFISIVANKLPHQQQGRARITGLAFALIFRILLLSFITFLIGMTKPLITIGSFGFSARDIILLLGGLFLLTKSTMEIHHKLEGEAGGEHKEVKGNSMRGVILQIVVLDIIFSFDSILTAVGLTQQLLLMIIAVILAMIVMMLFSGPISNFINNHPTLQMLALSFLILIGFMLALEAFHYPIPKGYIYFAVAFSLCVEMLNMRLMKKAKPVELKKRIKE